MRKDLIAQKKQALERLYAKYNRRELIKPDPLQFVYQYNDPADMEIAGLLASCLAYGRVGQIEKSVTDLLSRMSKSPSRFVMEFDDNKERALADFKHRFNTGSDISALLRILRTVLIEYASIENFFFSGYNSCDENIVPALSAFCNRLLKMHADTHGGNISRGFAYLLPTPDAGSACKRLNLFLRWMVRDDDVDSGLWESIDKSKLIVPVDVHMARLCRILGFYERKTVSLQTALEITRSFAKIAPADPVKYDFSLSRIGIIEDCNGCHRPQCDKCELLKFCHG